MATTQQTTRSGGKIPRGSSGEIHLWLTWLPKFAISQPTLKLYGFDLKRSPSGKRIKATNLAIQNLEKLVRTRYAHRFQIARIYHKGEIVREWKMDKKTGAIIQSV